MTSIFQVVKLGTTIFFFITGLSFAEDVSATEDLAQECVGHYVLNLPRNMEIALVTPASIYSTRAEDRLYPYRFSDGTVASFADGYTVTNQLSPAEFYSIVKKIPSVYEPIRTHLTPKAAKLFGIYDLGVPGTFAWRDQVGIGVYFYRDERLFFQGFSGDIYSKNYPDQFKKQVIKARGFLQNFKIRSPFSIPEESGICLPYELVSEKEKGDRHIAVTVRSLDHPEILITFEDERYDGKDATATERDTLIDALQVNYSRRSPKMKMLDDHKQMIDGREGFAMFIKLYRKTGQEDYVYLAHVFGTSKTPPTCGLSVTVPWQKESPCLKRTSRNWAKASWHLFDTGLARINPRIILQVLA